MGFLLSGGCNDHLPEPSQRSHCVACVRTPNPQFAKSFWLARFLRVVLTKSPNLRFRLDHTRIDSLYATQPDPVVAARVYLEN
jgi:hypothetical protein